jgi:hypothetical protein
MAYAGETVVFGVVYYGATSFAAGVGDFESGFYAVGAAFDCVSFGGESIE